MPGGSVEAKLDAVGCGLRWVGLSAAHSKAAQRRSAAGGVTLLTFSDAALGPRSLTMATPGAHQRNIGAVVLTCPIGKWPSQSHIKVVELRGLEPLTFSLRRHRVHLVKREPRVIDVHGAAAEAPWLQPGGTHGAHGAGLASRWCPCRVEPMIEPSSVGSADEGWLDVHSAFPSQTVVQ